MKPWRAVAVIGAGDAPPNSEVYRWAEQVGRLLAESSVAVITGGLSGVMEAASKGASEAGGMSIGILPGRRPSDANPYVRIPIPTGLGEARNFVVVHAADAAIAVGGEYGTLSEIAIALKSGKPVIGLGSWELAKASGPDAGILPAENPEAAVRLALSKLGAS